MKFHELEDDGREIQPLTPIPLKHEGEMFPTTDWEPPHPMDGKDCLSRFYLSVQQTGNDRTPRGQAWIWSCHVWTCYIRKRMNGQIEHIHNHFVDAKLIRDMVEAGKADDPWLGVKYTLQAHDERI